MRKFSFPFHILLKVRKEKENLARRQLLEAHIFMQEKMNRLEKLLEEKENLFQQIRSEASRAGDPAGCAAMYQYLDVLKKRILVQQNLLKETEAIVAKHQQKVMYAVQQRKIIENLHDKRFEEWEYEVDKEEKAICDELATIRYIRDHSDKKNPYE